MDRKKKKKKMNKKSLNSNNQTCIKKKIKIENKLPFMKILIYNSNIFQKSKVKIINFQIHNN